MRPRTSFLIIACVLCLAVAGGTADHAAAKVVQDGSARPAVAEGGIPLRAGSRPPVQYSLIGALAAEGRWFGRCAIWPWRLIGVPSFRHRWTGGRVAGQPAIEWVPPSMP